VATGDDAPAGGDGRFFGVVPVFLVDDVIGTVEYYRDVLGFEVDFVWGDPPSQGSVSRGDAIFNFTLSDPPGRRNSVLRAGPGNGVDAYVVVSGLDGLYEELRRRGALLRTSPAEREYGMREFKVEDSNGYILTFAEDVEDSR
jgi:uncharacterized glyoxalase superfamily protein PhnB